MEYRRFEQVCVIRLDPGEDIVEQVRSVAEREQIHLAAVQGLGAVDDFTVGVLTPPAKPTTPTTFMAAMRSCPSPAPSPPWTARSTAISI